MPKVINVTEEELISITKKLIDNKEYTNINCRYISNLANIGLGTFYKFFDSKYSLIARVILNDWILFRKEIIINNNLLDSIKSIYNALYLFTKKYHDFFQYESNSSLNMVHDKHSLLFEQIKEDIIKCYNFNNINYDIDIINFLSNMIIYYASNLYEFDVLNKILNKLI